MMDHDNLPPDVSRLLQAERADVAPPAGARDRVRSRVVVTVGAVAAGSAAAATAHAAASGKAATTAASVHALWAWAPVAPKLLAPLLVGSALVGGGVGLVQRAPDAAPRAPVVVQARTEVHAVQPPPVVPVVTTEVAPNVVEEPVAAPAALERRAVRAVPRSARTGAVHVPGLEEERQLLDDVRALLADGNAVEAAVRLDLHEKQHAHGQLVEEARALRVMVLVRRGDVEGARAAAARFHAAHPSSVLGSAVDAAISNAR